ncbi:MAG TPA: hypothetical protein VLI04_04815 [Nocardioidaceae bacterium]|nr:hypothetical protein [Nocardioidaceae bacterium]
MTTKLLLAVGLMISLCLPPALAGEDVTPPYTQLRTVENMVLGPHARFFYTGNDDASEVASFDVRVSRTSMLAARRSPWTRPAKFQGIIRDHVAPYVGPGMTVCIQVRARDTLGNVEAWPTDRPNICRTRVVHVSKLHRAGPVTVAHHERFLGGRAFVLHPRARLWLDGVRKGARVGVAMTLLPDEERGGYWTIPGVGAMATSWHPPTRRFTEVIDFVNTAEHYGRLTIHWDGLKTQPFEGVAVYPRWMQIQG